MDSPITYTMNTAVGGEGHANANGETTTTNLPPPGAGVHHEMCASPDTHPPSHGATSAVATGLGADADAPSSEHARCAASPTDATRFADAVRTPRGASKAPAHRQRHHLHSTLLRKAAAKAADTASGTELPATPVAVRQVPRS